MLKKCSSPWKLEISQFQSCTEKGEKSCKNGGKCVKGKCDCPNGFKGDLCEEEFYRTKTKIQKALKIQGTLVTFYIRYCILDTFQKY